MDEGKELMYTFIGVGLLTLLIFSGIGIYSYLSNKEVNPNNDVRCWDGCVYAEWYVYGYKNLSRPSELYEVCREACIYGESVFK